MGWLWGRTEGSTPSARQGLVVGATAAAGGLGLLPGIAGGLDPVGLLAWLALLAPAAGFACGAAGLRPLPFGLAPPAAWLFLVVSADMASERDLSGPLWASMAVIGLFAAGLGLGATFPRHGLGGAGALLLAGLLLAGLAVQGGLGREETSWGRTHPRLAALALDVSPIVLVLECGGWDDWTHSNPLVYEVSGVEWFPHRPYRGALAGPLVLVVGVLIGEVLARRAARRRRAVEDATRGGPRLEETSDLL